MAARGMNPERDYWRRLVAEVHAAMTYPKIAKAIGVSERQIFNIRNGCRPRGLAAVRLYTLHLKHDPMQNNAECIELHCADGKIP